jgi:GTP-binding protein EngB required for normal cell division
MDEDDQRENFDEIINEVIKWSYENNKYFIRHTITYNLLLMGKTRVGKTTIARVIENPCYLPPSAKLYSETKEITIHTVATTIFNHENIISCFNIIDTPGMFDKVNKSNKSLSNQQIKRAIDKCISEDVTNIHLFAFVINLQTNLDKQDIQSMIFVKDNYPFLHEYICLIVTHSEETNYQQREEKIEEFFQSDKIIQNNLKEFFGKRIFFMGSLRSQLTTYPNKQSVRQQIKNVHQMRDTFIEYIHTLDTNHSFNIHRVHNYNICNLL